jgi:hypothetical protein
VPRRTWLDSKIDVFPEELAASGMHLDRHRAGELITGQVRAVATLMRVTGATARSYLGDEIIKNMARRMLFEVAGERPGADLMEAPRTVPLSLALVGITVAALAEAMQVRARHRAVRSPRGRHHHLRTDTVRARADHRRRPAGAGRQPGRDPVPAVPLGRPGRPVVGFGLRARPHAVPHVVGDGLGDLLPGAEPRHLLEALQVD